MIHTPFPDSDTSITVGARQRIIAILAHAVSVTREKFSAEKNGNRAAFLERISGGGDLRDQLLKAITARVTSDGTSNKQIRDVVFSEVEKLWRNQPATHADRMGTILCSRDGDGGEEMTSARRAEILSDSSVGRSILADEAKAKGVAPGTPPAIVDALGELRKADEQKRFDAGQMNPLEKIRHLLSM
jgi:hypothetical protein